MARAGDPPKHDTDKSSTTESENMTKSHISRRTLLQAGAAWGSAQYLSANAQATFPSKTIRIVVPFPAGGAADSSVRMIAKPLSEALGQSVIVDNKPGGDGTIASHELMRAAPDGHTIMFGTASAMIYVPLIHVTKPPYDPIADFSPVSHFSSFTYFLFVHESIPVKTMQEFVAYTKANPGKVSYGTGDSTSIIAMAQLEMATKLDMVHVPYRGGAPAVADLSAGRIQLMLGAVDLEAKLQGKVRPLAVLLPKRSSLKPDVPTFAEAGLPQVNLLPWSGFFAPAKTPGPILERLSSDLIKIFQRPELQDFFARNGSILEGSSPAALGELLKTQLVLWRDMIKFAKIPTD